MNCAPSNEKQKKLLTDIALFLAKAGGLRVTQLADSRVRIHQLSDNKTIDVSAESLEDVLFRSDTEGEEFIQVNFSSGLKILLTDKLVGFKPQPMKGLDLGKLPRVVTTPDIVNVFEAIQDAIVASGANSHEVAILRKVLDAVLAGGEAVGFNLSIERAWLTRLPTVCSKISA